MSEHQHGEGSANLDATENKVVHEIDGIEEYDNKLPNWWLYTLYGSIAVAFAYWFIYQTSGFGELPRAAYESEMDRVAAAQAGEAKLVPITPEALTALAKDRGAVARGKQVFATTCAACHRGDGGGVVGPNLTDDFWMHGGAPEKVYKTIKDGVADKGMPAWEASLDAEKRAQLVGFIRSIQGVQAPNPKDPQGTLVE